MMRLLLVFLALLVCVSAGPAEAIEQFRELRDALERASEIEDQLQVVAQLRRRVQHGTFPAAQAGIVIHGLSKKPVIDREETVELLREMAAAPALTVVTMDGIAALWARRSYGTQTTAALIDMLRRYHANPGLSASALRTLGSALNPKAPVQNRTAAFSVLETTPIDHESIPSILDDVSKLLDSEVPLAERRAAFAFIEKASKAHPLPADVHFSLYKTATKEEDPTLRVAAWPIVIARSRRDNELRLSLGYSLTDQLTPPRPGFHSITFLTADRESRERAVAHLNDLWGPKYPPQFIDALIGVLAEHDSPASLAVLRKIRQLDGLSDEQLAALRQIADGNADDNQETSVREGIEEIIIPNLAANSLMDPLLTIEYSKDHKELAAATELLLGQYPDGPVPIDVVEAAYKVILQSKAYDATAVELVVRGDEAFAAREVRFLALVDRTPRRTQEIIAALSKLHGDADVETLVAVYVPDTSIAETFRGSMIGELYPQVRKTETLSSKTQNVLLEAARSAQNYGTIGIIQDTLSAANLEVPWSVRVKSEEFQWKFLGWGFIASLAVSGVAAFVSLVLLLVTLGASGARVPARGLWFVVWVLLVLSTVVAATLAFINSLGHGSTPPPNQAFPYFMATFLLALAFAGLALWLWLLNSRHRKMLSQ